MMQYKVTVVETNTTAESRHSIQCVYEQTVDTVNLPAIIAAVNQFTIAPTAAEIAASLKAAS